MTNEVDIRAMASQYPAHSSAVAPRRKTKADETCPANIQIPKLRRSVLCYKLNQEYLDPRCQGFMSCAAFSRKANLV